MTQSHDRIEFKSEGLKALINKTRGKVSMSEWIRESIINELENNSYEFDREELIIALSFRLNDARSKQKNVDFWRGFEVALEIAIEHLERVAVKRCK